MTGESDRDRVRRRVVVTGRVQGVFFRDSARREARARGLAGWVRNRPDGSVELVLEGGPEDVDAMLTWARTGPPAAQVADVVVRDEPPEGLTGFRVEG